MAAGHDNDLFHHVRDSLTFDFPTFMGGPWHIPQPFGSRFEITKFMVLEVVAAVIVFLIFNTLARKIRSGEPVRGRFLNFWEAIALALRDQVVRPTIGSGHHEHDEHGDAYDHTIHNHEHEAHHGIVKTGHPADKYLPFVWSIFFFVLICNLLGALPWMGSPTGSIWMTGVLALCTFVFVVASGSKELGFGGFWKALVPSMDLPFAVKVVLLPGMWVIEFVGLIIKHGVLAVRLFANIMAGHTVIAVMLSFVATLANHQLFYLVATSSVLGQVGIGMLELFVAFLQAYIFAFLATLFIGTAVHPH